MTLHFSIIYSTVHLRVRGHCSALEHFYELEGDDETYWNVCAVKDEVWTETYARDWGAVCWGRTADHHLPVYGLEAGYVTVYCAYAAAK